MVGGVPPEEEPLHTKARRLARTILSDIQLYTPDAVVQGVRDGTFFELVEKDIFDARNLYQSRVAESVRGVSNYLEDSFQQYIAIKKVELGIS